jgi:hypothetical protein
VADLQGQFAALQLWPFNVASWFQDNVSAPSCRHLLLALAALLNEWRPVIVCKVLNDGHKSLAAVPDEFGSDLQCSSNRLGA